MDKTHLCEHAFFCQVRSSTNTQIQITLRTALCPPSEKHDSDIRQRRSGEKSSRHAESRGSPSGCDGVEDVHNARNDATCSCTKHEKCLNQNTPVHPTLFTKLSTLNITRLTVATGKYCDSEIGQRCRCNTISTHAERCSTPFAGSCIENVHNTIINAPSWKMNMMN